MRIGINAFGCDHGRSGTGSYLSSLIKNLGDIPHEIELFGPELDRYTYTSGMDSISYFGVSTGDSLFAERLWHAASYGSFVRKRKYDAVLFPSGTKLLPLSFDVPSFVVVQDLVSDLHRNSDDGAIFGIYRRQLKKASRIIAASRSVRDDLVNEKIPAEKITVIHHGIDTSLFYPRETSDSEAILIHPFSIRRPYIIYASRVAYPSKNHVELIKAFALFKQKTGAPHRLVLAGSDGVNAEVVHREVLNSPVSSDILLTGYFPHQNLPELYSAADACIFPSSAEGVGMPVLEAMACSIPVACARSGALPEIAGDCALYFDHTNPEEIAACIEQLVRKQNGENDNLRSSLVQKASGWVSSFSWENCARETVDCIESALRTL
ncbi:MAG TPA: glycosyltransferase family 1 protein [Treponemataceae bacterium]|nr:glycosyltransferase family 1 protein [Treponemataceae bacterium]HQL34292.1 glycosyltransferase family 1 protein [Treponemataceae bacterium]